MDEQAVRNWLADRLPDYLADLETIVNIDSGSYNKEGVDRVADFFAERFARLGAEVTRVPNERFGDDLLMRWKGPGAGKVMILGHMDTVYPPGTVATHPFRNLGARLLGPGTADMKGGLLASLYALEALIRCEAAEPGLLTFLFDSDEEIHERHSRELIRAEAQQADVGLVLEPGRSNGAVVRARKGGMWVTFRVHGRAAHAGVNPEEGRSAIMALSRLIQEANALNGFRDGVTVNVGVIKGGSRPNVVPDEASAILDVRAWRQEDLAAVEEALRALTRHNWGADIRVEIALPPHKMPPMEFTPAGQKLLALAEKEAAKIGFDLPSVATGGGSDGSIAAQTGLPVLDGLGPVGGHAHSPQEYVDVGSIVPRTALLAALMAYGPSSQKG